MAMVTRKRLAVACESLNVHKEKVKLARRAFVKGTISLGGTKGKRCVCESERD